MAKGLLFSDYFLTEGLNHSPEYGSIADQTIRDLYKELEVLYRKFAQRKNPDEADTEDDLIRPILDKLGFFYTRQKSPSRRGRTDVPDFVLFASREDKDVFDSSSQSSRPWSRAVCILEGKKWKRPLDSGDRTDPIDPSVPSNQMLRYLSAVDVASNGKLVWGILANGAVWRLYYHRYPSRADGYIEFDLNDILHDTLAKFSKPTSEMLEVFKAFVLLLRKEAFVPTDWRPDKSFLDLSLEEGRRWEERIAGSLTEKVFLQVFPLLAKGAVEDSRTRGAEPDEYLLDQIYSNTLIFLYRLLFLLYAEDRNLLPVSTVRYRGYSLSNMRGEIADVIDNKVPLSSTATSYWDKLKSLFRIINKGDPIIGIPPYNGGLFDPSEFPFLEKYSVPDSQLAPAIDYLSRELVDGTSRRINYRDLSVRQLGSIYEGLLEFSIRIAETDLVITKTGKRERYTGATSGRNPAVKKGEIYLTNDRSERKASGSYFTPDEIVQYIVRNVVERLIQARIHEFNQKKLELMTKSEFRRRSPKWKTRELRTHDVAMRMLDTKVLDPAMGSGHFLVGVVDYVSDRTLEILAEFSGDSYFGNVRYTSPLAGNLEKLRRNIKRGAVKGNYSVDESKLDDKSLIRRIILKRCIYGVDINPLAVELAKVSLWLHTFTAGATLSFLDHHLKCGNSLVHASPEMLLNAVSGSVFKNETESIKSAIVRMESLEELSDVDLSEVEKSSEIHQEISRELEPFKTLLNLCVAGLLVKPRAKSTSALQDSPLRLLDGSRGNPIELVKGNLRLAVDDERILESALRFCKTLKAFHWQLEFPEVWYSTPEGSARGGFDVVLGNPPYISYGLGRVGKLNKETEQYLRAAFQSSAEYKISTYALFVELAIRLSRDGGIQGLILPDSFLVGRYYQKIRTLILENGPIELMRFDEDFWEGGDVGFPVVWIGSKGPSSKRQPTFVARFVNSPAELAVGNYSSREIEKRFALKNKRRRIRLMKDENDSRLVERIESKGGELADWLQMHHGIRSKTGRGSVVSRDRPKGDLRWKKGLVESNQVKPFIIEYRDDFILVDPELLFSGGWDADDIEGPKILIRRTGDSIVAAVDTNGYYHTNALIYGIAQPEESQTAEQVDTLRALCAVLNSELFNSYYHTATGKKGRTFPQVEIDGLGELSVPDLSNQQGIPKELHKILSQSNLKLGQPDIVSLSYQRMLALLAERMEQLEKGRARILGDFIEWLSVSTRSDPTMWKNKTRLYDTSLLDFDVLIELITENEDLSVLRPAKRSDDLRVLKDNHDEAMRRIGPVLDSIQETTRMIENLVYQLYSLEYQKDVFST